MVGVYDKIKKFGNQLWDGVNTGLNVAQTVTPIISAVSGLPVIDTVANAFGSIVNGVNEIMTTNAINKEIKKWNKQNEQEVKELNEYAKWEADENEKQRKKKENQELDYYKSKMVKLPIHTQEEIDAQNHKYTTKNRERLNARQFNR
jgi:heme/copper-type cytochrome/quinol oxidase subunit 1